LQDDLQIQENLAAQLPASVALLNIWNKFDLAPSAQKPSGSDHTLNGIFLSAKTGLGIDQLRSMLLQTAGWLPANEGLYLARERHVQALKRVQSHIEMAHSHLRAQAQSLDLLAEELRLSQTALNEITGEFNADDLLGVIFSSFCIGK